MADLRLLCPHASECPGCPLYELDYASTLDAKGAHVEASAAAYAELARIPILPAAAAEPTTHYRRRAKLVVDRDRVGLYSRTGHQVLDLPHCRILEPAIEQTLAALRRLLPASVPIRGVDLRNTPEGVFITFVVEEGIALDRLNSEIERLAGGLPQVVGVAVSFRPAKSVQLLGGDLTVVSGPSRIRVPRPPDVFVYESHGAFAQTHPGQERALETAVVHALQSPLGVLSGKRVLELFSGAGALSLRLASLGADVTAVEAYAPAAELARLAAEEQNLGVTVHAADAAEFVQASVKAGSRFDAVIVNPPRRGLSAELRAAVVVLAPRVLVYVSCRPETLARDAADLARKGMRARSFSPYDMMPWTDQVETLSVFAPGPTAALQVIQEDDRLIAVVKGPHEPTTPQGEHAGSLLDRVRAHVAFDVVPIHRLDIGTSGVCLFAKKTQHVASLSKALAEGDKEYVALARGIVRPKGSIHRPIPSRGRPLDARTRYKRMGVVAGHSLLRVEPEHGRKHQIRLHLASIGHPILGDARYGDRASNRYFELRHGLDRTFLHCERVALGLDGKVVEFEAELAPDLAAVLDSMQRNEDEE